MSSSRFCRVGLVALCLGLAAGAARPVVGAPLCSPADAQRAREVLAERRRLVEAGAISQWEFLVRERRVLDTLECAGALNKSQYCGEMRRNLSQSRALVEATENETIELALAGDYFEEVANLERFCGN